MVCAKSGFRRLRDPKTIQVDFRYNNFSCSPFGRFQVQQLFCSLWGNFRYKKMFSFSSPFGQFQVQQHFFPALRVILGTTTGFLNHPGRFQVQQLVFTVNVSNRPDSRGEARSAFTHFSIVFIQSHFPTWCCNEATFRRLCQRIRWRRCTPATTPTRGRESIILSQDITPPP